MLWEDAGQEVQEKPGEEALPAPTFAPHCYGQFLQVLKMTAACDFSICFSSGYLKLIVSINLFVLVLELRTLMRWLGSLLLFTDSDCFYLLTCTPVSVDPDTSQPYQCALPESTQQNEILFIFLGGTRMKQFWIHNSWQLWDACNPLPHPGGCLHHCAYSLIFWLASPSCPNTHLHAHLHTNLCGKVPCPGEGAEA